MNRTITMRELSAEIAAATSITGPDAESFLRELAAVVAEGLADGESVRIKGIGTFSATSDTVMFKPDDELAEAVNMPFAAFEAIELDDNLTEEMLSAPFSPEAELPEPQEEQEGQEEQTPDTPDETPDPESCHDTTDTTPDASVAEEPCDNVVTEEPANENDSDSEEPVSEPATETDIAPTMPGNQSPRRCGLLWFFAIVACAGCFMAGYYFGYRHGYGSSSIPDTVTTTDDEPVADTASIAIAVPDTATAPVTPDSTMTEITTSEPAVITDTIKRGRFLTTMARHYYGRMEFWVYIYEENASKLGDPDRVSSGTTVVIPPAGKYGIDPSDPESIRRAEMKSKEIYAPYKK